MPWPTLLLPLLSPNVQNGLLFGLPIVLDTNSEDIQPGDKVLLTYQGTAIAAVTIDSKWSPNKPLECLKCYGTSSLEHPAVQMVAMERGKYYMGEEAQFSCACSTTMRLGCWAEAGGQL